MTPEDWQRVKPILASALELDPANRASFLKEACADPSLREEIQSLIFAHEQAGALNSAALPSFPESVLSTRLQLTSGTRLGDFQILSLLGAGGMGEVYRARDLRLERDVAIKVLPKFVSFDPERLRRFEQEAKAAAGLNHPNILAVFQMGTHEGAPYLVSELLEGETLREQVKRGPMPPKKAVDYGVQIAHGLAAAHEKGIVHRDLKPENLFVTRDGRIKILDFGLAKLLHAEGETQLTKQTLDTQPGAVLGTVGYMSPEQVRGLAADHRADIFAFGAILYELLTGKRAFHKSTFADTMSAILNDDPPPASQVSPSVPHAIERAVHRCLEKRPEQRFQSASDLGFALEALSDSEAAPAGGVAKSRSALPLKAIFAVLLVAALIWIGSTLFSQPAPLKLGRAVQLTNDGKMKDRLVTDGTRLYFDEQVADNVTIAQVSTFGGETGNLPTVMPFPQIEDISPRGSELLIKAEGADVDAALWLLPVPSGAPRRLGNVSASIASWLPDGERIAYVKADTDLYVVNADGTGSNKLLSKSGIQGVASSPDGRWFRLNIWDKQRQKTALWEVRADGSDLHQVLPIEWNKRSHICCAHWTGDGKYFLFVATNLDFGGGGDIWALSECHLPLFGCKARPVQLTDGPLAYREPIPSRDGRKIFTIGEQKRAEVIRYDNRSRQYTRLLSGSSAVGVEYSRDGQWVTWVSYPENTLWCSKVDGSDRRQLTFPPLVILFPRWSPDSKRIAFTTHEPDRPWKIYTISRDGGTPEPLFLEEHRQLLAAWGPNGNSVAIGRPNRENPMAIELLDLKTGKATEIPGSQDLWQPAWSPDGRYIVAQSKDYRRLMVFDSTIGKWTEMAQGILSGSQFSHDSKYVYFEDFGKAVYRVPVQGGKKELVVDFKDLRRPIVPSWALWFGLTPDDSLLTMRDLGTQEIYAFDVLP
jgi:Tol biopolymer transport system component